MIGIDQRERCERDKEGERWREKKAKDRENDGYSREGEAKHIFVKHNIFERKSTTALHDLSLSLFFSMTVAWEVVVNHQNIIQVMKRCLVWQRCRVDRSFFYCYLIVVIMEYVTYLYPFSLANYIYG
eukprot:sb/3475451/